MGFGFRVSGFGFRVSGLGFRVHRFSGASAWGGAAPPLPPAPNLNPPMAFLSLAGVTGLTGLAGAGEASPAARRFAACSCRTCRQVQGLGFVANGRVAPGIDLKRAFEIAQRLQPPHLENTEPWSGPYTEPIRALLAGSYLRPIETCITQLKDQGPSRTCNESKKKEEKVTVRIPSMVALLPGSIVGSYLNPIDFLYHATLDLACIENNTEEEACSQRADLINRDVAPAPEPCTPTADPPTFNPKS